jgi:integrase
VTTKAIGDTVRGTPESADAHLLSGSAATSPAVGNTSIRRLSDAVRQLETRLAAGSSSKEQGFVFTTGIGTPVEPRRVTREFKAALAEAKLPTIRLHDLRHSCATLLLAQGVNPRVVTEALGTRKSVSRSTPTPTSCQHSRGKPRQGWTRCCRECGRVHWS